jgi:hypothetical protein
VRDLRTMIGVVGVPKRAITFSIQDPVALLIQPRCCPQSAQISGGADGAKVPAAWSVAIKRAIHSDAQADERRLCLCDK